MLNNFWRKVDTLGCRCGYGCIFRMTGDLVNGGLALIMMSVELVTVITA